MGLTVLAPLRMVENLAGWQIWTYLKDRRPKDFTGWSGDWRIARAGVDTALATGAATLNDIGSIRIDWTAADASALADHAARRGAVLPDVMLEIELTDDTDTLLFQAAVAWRPRA